MRKILTLFAIFFFYFNNASSEEITINSLLKEGYKIDSEEIVKREKGIPFKIVTLTKSKSYATCMISLNYISGPNFIKCIKP